MKKKLQLMEREFVFNYMTDEYGEGGYTVTYKEDLTDADVPPEIFVVDDDGEEVNNPIFLNAIHDEVRLAIYSPNFKFN